MDLKPYIDEANKCVKCGMCRTVCPTFNANLKETASARGKIALIETAVYSDASDFASPIAIDPSGKAFLTHINECTMCGACLENCPKDVDTPMLVQSVRTAYNKLGIFRRVLFSHVLPSYKLSNILLRFANLFSGLIFKKSLKREGVVSRLNLPVLGQGRLLPKFPSESFINTYKSSDISLTGEEEYSSSTHKTVAFFTGCGMNFMRTDIAEKITSVLKREGFNVVVPDTQVCCSMPSYTSGDTKNSLKMVKQNIDVFSNPDYDFIVTGCATCGVALKNQFSEVIKSTNNDTALLEKAEAIAQKSRDFVELLVNDSEFMSSSSESVLSDEAITFHNPCHLGRGQNIYDEPLKLLEKQGYDHKPLATINGLTKCCGFGAGLGFTNYDMALRIGKDKVSDIVATGAKTLVTECPGCMAHLEDSLNQEGNVEVRVKHFAELL